MNLEPLLSASPAIQIHAYAAIAAFILGALILFRRKGGPVHRTLGRVWVALMLVVAVSSFFIHTIRLWGPWSPIHLLSIFTLVSLAYGVVMIRRRNVAAHMWTMRSTYGGALIIAGLFTFLPGRIMYEVVFADLPAASLWIWPLLAAALVAGVVWRRARRITMP